MGLKDIFRGENGGTRCVQMENGVEMCSRMEIVSGELVATGSNLPIAMNTDTCTATILGEHSLMDKDREWANQVLKAKEQGCRKGIA